MCFNPRRSCERRHRADVHARNVDVVSIHAARVSGDLQLSTMHATRRAVSIHAARVSGDSMPICQRCTVSYVSIHAARVSGDVPLSARATPCCFNPRRSCERRHRAVRSIVGRDVSIHAARVSGDSASRMADRRSASVSIHAARVSGDIVRLTAVRSYRCFNPRRSCERRQRCAVTIALHDVFQSTPLV